jgi:hypothetical protein
VPLQDLGSNGACKYGFTTAQLFTAIFTDATLETLERSVNAEKLVAAVAAGLIDENAAEEERETMHWRHTQAEKLRPDAGNVVKGLSQSVRMASLSWMHQVLIPWGVEDRILFAAVELLDRYCALTHISTERLQEIVIAVIRITLKMEGQEIPQQTIVNTLMGKADSKRVDQAELHILTTLRFDIRSPTPFEFMTSCKFKKLQQHTLSLQVWQITRGLLFMSLGRPDFHYRYPSSVLAAVALHLALSHCCSETDNLSRESVDTQDCAQTCLPSANNFEKCCLHATA